MRKNILSALSFVLAIVSAAPAHAETECQKLEKAKILILNKTAELSAHRVLLRELKDRVGRDAVHTVLSGGEVFVGGVITGAILLTSVRGEADTLFANFKRSPLGALVGISMLADGSIRVIMRTKDAHKVSEQIEIQERKINELLAKEGSSGELEWIEAQMRASGCST